MHYVDYHPEHSTKHCCGCIPVDTGAKILGFLLILSSLGYLSQLFSSATVASGVFGLIVVAYPTIRFIQVLTAEHAHQHVAR